LLAASAGRPRARLIPVVLGPQARLARQLTIEATVTF